ncbi:MAG: CPCC family cysteine-rich protein [Terracidiphilus sp.]
MNLVWRNLAWRFPVHFSVSSAVAVRYRCPCCGYRTLDAPGTLQLCPVCWWEDDGQEDQDASDVRLTVNGQLSLNEARDHYASVGASHPRFLPYVRKPLSVER